MSSDRDLDRALAWAADRLEGPLVSVAPLTGGMTSTMLALTTASGARAVLRLVTEEPWRTHGAELVARERAVQLQLAPTPVPAPVSLAVDADGGGTGHPTHLMSLLPGAVDVDRTDRLDALAATLAGIHAVRADPAPRLFQPWAWEAKYVVPAWTRDAAAWTRAFEILRGPQPAYEPVFLHRDFHLRNVLWDGPEVSGVVDWVETSTGPAWLDVAHCRTNLATDHGSRVADRFAAAYSSLTGVAPDPYWDVLDVVGFLPRPGTAEFTTDPARLARLDDHLVHVVAAYG